MLLYLLDTLGPEALTAKPAHGKGRSVGENVAHAHNVRLMWLQSAAPDRLAGLANIERADATDPALLRSALLASGEAIAALLTDALSGRVRGFRPHPAAFLAT